MATESNNTPRKPVSARQLCDNRAAAKKSTASTAETVKERLPLDALEHDLAAGLRCLPAEPRSACDQRHSSYGEFFQPADRVERDLVASLFAARCHQQRAMRLETKLLTDCIMRRRTVAPQNAGDTPCDVAASLAFRELADTIAMLQVFDGYESLEETPRSTGVCWTQLSPGVDRVIPQPRMRETKPFPIPNTLPHARAEQDSACFRAQRDSCEQPYLSMIQ